MILLFLKGALLGLALTAPVGPINLLCIRRSLNHGAKIGFFTGLGAATADTFFGAVAAFGLTQISGFLTEYQRALQIFGGCVFTLMGISLIRSKKTETEGVEIKGLSPFKAYSSSLFLTLHNPATIFAFLIAFATLKLGEETSTILGASLATLGVFTGASLWWLTLSWGSAKLRSRISPAIIHKINVGTGILLIIFAGLLFIGVK